MFDISIAGVVVILACFLAFAGFTRNPLQDLIRITFALSLIVQAGYVMKIGSIEVSYHDISMLATVLYAFLIAKAKLEAKRLLFVFFLMILILFQYLVTANSELIIEGYAFGVDTNIGTFYWRQFGHSRVTLGLQQLKTIIKLAIFMPFAIITLYEFRKKSLFKVIIRDLLKLSLLLQIGLGFVELIARNLTRNSGFTLFLTRLIGLRGSSQSTGFFLRGGIVGVQGLNSEPSTYAFFVFIAGVLLLLNLKQLPIKPILLIMYPIMMLLSTSVTGLLCAIGFSVVFLLKISSYYRRRRVAVFLSMLVFMVSAMLAYVSISKTEFGIYLVTRIQAFLGGTDYVSSSEVVRRRAIDTSFRDFLAHPLIGIGLGSTVSIGFIPTLLTNLGVVGALIYFRIIVPYSRIIMSFDSLILILIYSILLYGTGSIYFITSPIMILIVGTLFTPMYSERPGINGQGGGLRNGRI